MERKTAKELGLAGIPETLCLLWTKGVHREENSERVGLEISGKLMVNGKIESTKKYRLNSVNVVEDLDLPEQSLPLNALRSRYKHLNEIPIVGYEKVTPTILIGIKHARLAVLLEAVEGGENDPIATRSRLGWQIYGTTKGNTRGHLNVHHVKKCPCQERDDEVHKLVKDYFTVENFGVVANAASLDSKENERALKMMKECTIRTGNRFETRLLWKNDA